VANVRGGSRWHWRGRAATGRRSRHGTRALAACVSVAAGLALIAASCSPSEEEQLGKLVTRLAGEQGVEEATIRQLLDSQGSGIERQLTEARSLERALPARPVPDLDALAARFEGFGAAAVEQLESSVCSAVIDVLRTHQVPSGSDFVAQYLQGLGGTVIPQAKLQEVADQFTSMYDDALAGRNSAIDVRLQMMEIEYC
jgi:hypothetical protein